MRYFMPLCLTVLLLGMAFVLTACQSQQMESIDQRQGPKVDSELRVFEDKGTVFYKCRYYPLTEYLSCDIAPSEPNQPRCL